ncbi:MAG: VCBS repeat-containing protein [Deltaproteobacteria bacterium]|nr:VCBS repeat-containing protein [Deltaproteobacteria bacterium]
MHRTTVLALALLTAAGACKKQGEERQVPVVPATTDAAAGPETPAPPPASDAAATPPGDAAAGAPAPEKTPALLIVQSRFVDELQPDGTTKPKPGPAALIVLRQVGAEWEPEELTDPDSNVFHKAVPFDPDGQGEAILTIGAVGAYLKAWRKRDGVWSATTLWHPTFGGQIDRLRDLELGDVDGDGRPELVIATHDQGVVAVLSRRGETWEAVELDKRPDTFVHEVEIGDLDGDGKLEFFTTPSLPNVSNATRQGGGIDMYKWDGTTYARTPVVWSEEAHAKEILVADLDGDGRAALFAVLEAKTVAGQDCTKLPDFVPLRIPRYELEGGTFVERDPATVPDCMARFLAWGDVDGDGTNELVLATKNAGLWLLRRPERGDGTAEPIDADSGGFEHATLVADLDGDGTAEIYVAADAQHELRRYRWNAASRSFDRETILELGGDQITWNVTWARLP